MLTVSPIRMNLREYLEFQALNEREDDSNRKGSANSYGQPNIMQLETDRLYKDGDQWCYKAAE